MLVVSFNFMIERGGVRRRKGFFELKLSQLVEGYDNDFPKVYPFFVQICFEKTSPKGKARVLVFCAIMRVLHDLGQFLPLPSGAMASFFHEVLQLLLFARLFISKEEKERRSKKSNEPGRRRRGHMIL